MSKGHVLIVDDNAINIEVAAKTLKREDIEVSFATSGESALGQVQKGGIDLILLDIMMPGMSGYEVCHKLKEDENTKDIPVVFFTAKTDVDSLLQAFKNGAVDYISKPFNIHEMIARVSTHLELSKTRNALIEATTSKDQFFSIIAHDLRSPVGYTVEYLKMLLDDFSSLSEKERMDDLKVAIGLSEQTFHLLENLLQWSLLEKDKMSYKPVKIDMNEAVQEIIDLNEYALKNKKIKVIKRKDQDVFIQADPNITATVIRNILSNTIKFSFEDGEIEIFIRKLEDGRASLTIKDHGVGIAPERLVDLYSAGKKGSTRGTNGEIGSGMGLPLCKDLMEKNGGELIIKSEVNVGTESTLIFPSA